MRECENAGMHEWKKGEGKDKGKGKEEIKDEGVNERTKNTGMSFRRWQD